MAWDSKSQGCGFESRRDQTSNFFLFFLPSLSLSDSELRSQGQNQQPTPTTQQPTTNNNNQNHHELATWSIVYRVDIYQKLPKYLASNNKKTYKIRRILKRKILVQTSQGSRQDTLLKIGQSQFGRSGPRLCEVSSEELRCKPDGAVFVPYLTLKKKKK